MRRIRVACCARAASGHAAAAALPANVMNSRRCMCPQAQETASYRLKRELR
jgi:hypothetical protein